MKVWKNRPRRNLLGLNLLFGVLLLLASCSQVTVAVRLKQAQDLFNEASRLTILGENYRDYVEKRETQGADSNKTSLPSLTDDAMAKYQLVLDLLDDTVFENPALHLNLRINAYALKAVAQWRLRQYKDAIQTAFKGQHLCASEPHSNPRDCGMLVIVGALVVNSETLDRFEALKTERHSGNLTREESADLAEKLQFALNQLDELAYPADEPITVYANQQKLIILGNMLDIWSAYSRSDTEQERADVMEKAMEICGMFPDEYPSKELTRELARKRLGLEPCGPSGMSP